MSFLTVCLNPTLQKTLSFPSVTPDAVNRTAVHRLDAGGKGIHVTRVLNQLGKEAVHLTHLGGEMKPLFLSLCEPTAERALASEGSRSVQDGLAINWVESNSQIRFCYTVINESNGEVTELVEEAEPVGSQTETRLLEKFDSLLSGSSIHCLIISGTKAAGYSDTVIPEMVRKAKEKGLFVILDIKGSDLKESLKYEPDIIKPNLDEFISTFRFGINGTHDLILDIAKKYKCRIILTNGSQKILVIGCAANSEVNYFEVDPAVCADGRVINTTGCGDAFTAGLAAVLFPDGNRKNAADFKTAINEGIRCGALNAGLLKPGTIR
ncbi:MAG: PfkB family carbohydrate kinase [Treponema sp.]|nr:PfkB family carbohydrate kinase [Treponema sp.]